MYTRNYAKVVLLVILSASWLACENYEDYEDSAEGYDVEQDEVSEYASNKSVGQEVLKTDTDRLWLLKPDAQYVKKFKVEVKGIDHWCNVWYTTDNPTPLGFYTTENQGLSGFERTVGIENKIRGEKLYLNVACLGSVDSIKISYSGFIINMPK